MPEGAQTDASTAELVREIREQSDAIEEEHGVTDVRVTGQTAVTIDVSERLAGALLPFGLVVVGLVKPEWLPLDRSTTRAPPRPSRASRTMLVRMFVVALQPTILRENASTMKHTYAIPDLVGT